MSLHVTSIGQGPRLVLLHGWALNSHVWDDVVPRLASEFTIDCVDLPGHGASAWQPGIHDLDSLAQAVAPHLGAQCHVLGWSLGGMVALKLALKQPARIEKLVLVASTPRFVASPDWPSAMQPAVLEHFATRLREDYPATVREFLTLQVRGDERAHEALRILRRRVLIAGELHQAALRMGLKILRDSDLRAELRLVRSPTLVIAGERDALVPAPAAAALAAGLPQARAHLIERAAHAPFLSHLDEFCSEVRNFLARAQLGSARSAS
ncbi:MAG TPA: pimeloyl-ACP methyl ester esterase BioH [Steroidobacteraceae bacterium]|nr:pimeloyl-ACP methyl ester esterase BioH [Steroidobacteraceae bacterium]